MSNNLKIKAVLKYKNHQIKVYYSPDWEEYIVKFYKNGVYLTDADYHDSDPDSALSTAHEQLKAWDAFDSTTQMH